MLTTLFVTLTLAADPPAAIQKALAGITPDEMRSIALPTLIVPGNDRTHPRGAGQAAHRLMPNSEYREVMAKDVDADVDFDGWERKNGMLAAYFVDFLRRRERAS